jgi:hypothetical protein
MSRVADPTKLKLWRDRCVRCSQSELTTAEFCQVEGVTTASFYAWRRKLGLATPRRPKPTDRLFQQLVVRPTAPVLSARLPGGIELEVPTAEETALRVVVQELVRADRQSEPARC